MDIAGLRIALFSGNYNMTTDGANRALNRLVEYLQRHGATVRVYSPVNDRPAFEPQGTLVPIPSLPIPGRSEYRVPLFLPAAIRADMAAFQPHVVHISSPDFAAMGALRWARGTWRHSSRSCPGRSRAHPARNGLPAGRRRRTRRPAPP